MSRRIRVARGRAGNATPFSPAQFSGLVAWYRADKGITIGAGVSAWADQSGTGDANKNMAQATGSRQPTFNASDAAYNGKSTLSLASASVQFLASNAWTVSLSQPFTVFVVGNDDGSINEQLYFDAQQGAAQESTIFNLDGTTYHMLNGAPSINGSAISNAKRVLGGIFNGASSSLFNNAKTAVATGTVGAFNLTGLTAGASLAASVSLNGKLAELIVYNSALTQSQVNQVLAYCGSRYAITIGA